MRFVLQALPPATPNRLLALVVAWAALVVAWAAFVTPATVDRAQQAQGADAEPHAPVELRDGDRVVWIGGTFVERMQQDNYLESLLAAAFPGKRLTVRNLGWSGDTVGGESRGVFGGPNEGFARLLKDVKETKPSLLVVQYGANEANRGAEGVAPFVAGLNRLLDAVADTKARVLLVSPPPREKLAPPLPDPAKYNEQLKQYEAALQDVALKRGCGFVSLADVYQAIPAPWISPSGDFRFTENGLHFNTQGAYLTAAAIAAKFGAKFEPWTATIDAKSLQAEATGVTVAAIEKTGPGLKFEVTDRHGPVAGTPKTAGRKDDPVLFAGSPILKITGLPPGTYVLKADGKELDKRTAAAWAQGSPALAASRQAQAEKLRTTIREKNELYFHRHRPQNETYLFLFRKHEQGRNAVEIPQFDPLVAEKETLIFELSRPVTQHLELTKAE